MSSDTIASVQQTTKLGAHNFTQAHAQNTATSHAETEVDSIARDQISLDNGSSRQSLDTMQRLGGIASSLNETAIRIRETGEGLKSSADIVSKMGTELNRIVKNYPPFSIEDENRKKILMSYISLRKQIEKLTVPSPPPPMYEKIEGMWEKFFTKKDGKTVTPSLGVDASDSEVEAAASQLSITGSSLSRLLTTIENSL